MAEIFHNISILAVCFFVLTKAADALVDGAVGIAEVLKIPKIIIGIVLVSFATTAPEFTVTLISAVKGAPGMALGNAVGSVIADDAIALALAILFSATAITVNKKILKTSGLFLIGVSILTFIFASNGFLSRIEGVILLVLMFTYISFLLYMTHRSKKTNTILDSSQLEEVSEHEKPGSVWKQIFRFIVGLAGVVISGELLVGSASALAEIAGISDAVIGQTIVAIGTSLPEIATCIIAAKKGHADLAVGDIIGADILNLLWIIGAASTISTLQVDSKTIYFSFPVMLGVVSFMIFSAFFGYKYRKWQGAVLLLMYGGFLTGNLMLILK